MPKLALKFVSFLLVLCLLADPLRAFASSTPSPAEKPFHSNLFEQQAVDAAHLQVIWPISKPRALFSTRDMAKKAVFSVSGGRGKVLVPDSEKILRHWQMGSELKLRVKWRDSADDVREVTSPLLAVAIRERDRVPILIIKNTDENSFDPIPYDRIEEISWDNPIFDLKSLFGATPPAPVSNGNPSVTRLDNDGERIAKLVNTRGRNVEIVVGAYKLFLKRDISNLEIQRLLRLVDIKVDDNWLKAVRVAYKQGVTSNLQALEIWWAIRLHNQDPFNWTREAVQEELIKNHFNPVMAIAISNDIVPRPGDQFRLFTPWPIAILALLAGVNSSTIHNLALADFLLGTNWATLHSLAIVIPAIVILLIPAFVIIKAAIGALRWYRSKPRDPAIQKGFVFHWSINREIRKHIENGHTSMIIDSTQKSDYTDSRQHFDSTQRHFVYEEATFQTIQSHLSNAAKKAMERIAVVVVLNEAAPYLESLKSYRRVHVGKSRRTIYIGENLWERIKEDPEALAGFFAYSLVELQFPFHIPYLSWIGEWADLPVFNWIREQWAVKAEIAADPNRKFRSAIQESLTLHYVVKKFVVQMLSQVSSGFFIRDADEWLGRWHKWQIQYRLSYGQLMKAQSLFIQAYERAMPDDPLARVLLEISIYKNTVKAVRKRDTQALFERILEKLDELEKEDKEHSPEFLREAA
jgi:hypothetical protein